MRQAAAKELAAVKAELSLTVSRAAAEAAAVQANTARQVRKLAAQGEEATPLLVPQSSEPATKQVRVHPNPNP